MDFYDILLAKKLSGNGGGGGGSSYKLLKSHTFEGVVGSTTSVSLGTISVGAEAYTSAKIIYIKIRHTGGKANSRYCGADIFCINEYPANGATTDTTASNRIYMHYNSGYAGAWGVHTTNNNGIYVTALTNTGDISFSTKQTSTVTNIGGDYKVDVYALDWPDDISPFFV